MRARTWTTCFALGLAGVVTGCQSNSPPSVVTPSPTASTQVPLTVAAPSIDPFVANFLAANNSMFDLQEPPPDVAITAVRAIEIVASRTKGPIKKADAVFGVLHANLGAIAPPKAWLVVLVGPGFVPQAGSAPSTSQNPAAASFAQAQNFYFVYAFVEATGGSMIIAGGSSPPP
jgi:hypothetical protein